LQASSASDPVVAPVGPICRTSDADRDTWITPASLRLARPIAYLRDAKGESLRKGLTRGSEPSQWRFDYALLPRAPCGLARQYASLGENACEHGIHPGAIYVDAAFLRGSWSMSDDRNERSRIPSSALVVDQRAGFDQE
jgi:hypothetical protein